jgi:hypothetical protein
MKAFYKVVVAVWLCIFIISVCDAKISPGIKPKATLVPTASSGSLSSPKEILNEEFFDNHNNWAETKNNDVNLKIANGYYAIENKSKKDPICPCVTLDINPDLDFLIEANIIKVDGANDAGFGVVWGFQNTNNYYSLKINGNGYYSYWKSNNEKSGVLIDWTLSSFIKKENAANKVTIKRIGDKLLFFVNNHQLGEASYEKFFGNNIGLNIDPKLKLKIDNLVVIQGNHNLTMDTNLFKEDFGDNTNGWYEGSDKEVTAKVVTGQYLLEHKADKTSYFINHPVEINTAQDFKIETIVAQTAGASTIPFNLTWGGKDADNFYFFGINGDGKYAVGKNSAGQRTNVIDWTPSSAIKIKLATNKMGIQKSGNKIKIWINDNQVGEIPFEKFFGNNVGFELVGKAKYEIDNLVVGNR